MQKYIFEKVYRIILGLDWKRLEMLPDLTNLKINFENKNATIQSIKCD